MTETTTPTPETPEAPVTPEAPAPKPPSRVGGFLRIALRWAVGIALVFLLGLLVTWFTLVKPKTAELRELQTELGTAQAELETLRPLQAENEELQAQADLANTRLAVVEALVDVTSAQVALFMNDPEAAHTHLSETGDRLTAISSLIGVSAADEIATSRTRLDQILAEIDQDPFAARRDLEVLANTLATLAREVPAP